MITHNGRNIPTYAERWDPNDKTWIWVAWDEVLDGATISTSAWVLPDDWTEHDTQTNQSVEDDGGNEYSAANGVLTSTTATGLQTISNQVTLSDGREYERSVSVVVGDI